MRLAFVTPFFADSAVGELAGRVATEIEAAGHDVVLIGCGQAPYLATDLPFLGVGENETIDPAYLKRFDAVVYNAANHPSSFPIYAAAEHVPGIVILCDRVYAHGYDAYALRRLRIPQWFAELGRRYYGEAGADFAHRFRTGKTTAEDFERFLFIEPLLANARAALVHSHEFQELVSKRWNGPVGRLKGFSAPPRPATAPQSRSAIGVADDDFLIAFLGYIAPTRSIEVLFTALRDRADLAQKTKVAIVGRIDDPNYAQSLKNTAIACGLADKVIWAFNADDAFKHTILSHADAAYNCRFVNTEGSSATLIEQLSYGIPTIVNANGFARDIPADAACFVERTDILAGVTHAIETLERDPALRRRIGANATAWIAENSSTGSYAGEIVKLANETMPPAAPAVGLPLVSIAITSYNYEKYIGRAIRSALAQTYPNVEVVVSDNASTDSSVAIIDGFARIDPRVRYVVNAENVGMVENFRRVRDLCQGEYIAFLSADDIFYPQHIASAVDYYRSHPECDLRHAGVAIIDEAGNPARIHEVPPTRAIRSYSARDEFGFALSSSGHAMLQTILFPRSVLAAAGEFSDDITAGDTDIIFRCARAGYRFAYDSQPTVGFMQHENSTSSPNNFVRTGTELRDWLKLLDDNLGLETVRRCVGRRRRINGVIENAIRRVHEYAGADAEAILATHGAALASAREKIASIPDRLDGDRAVEPRFSIVLPTVGSINVLRRSIESVLAQSLGSWELIVVSNAGPNLEGILRTWVDPARLVYVETLSSESAGAARNAALRIARGETIAYLDEGDTWSPVYLASVTAALDQHGADIVRVGATAVYYDITAGGPGAAASRDADLYSAAGAPFVDAFGVYAPLSAIAHRNFALEIAGEFNEGLPQLEEWEFLLRLTANPQLKKIDIGDPLVDAAFYRGLAFQSLGRRLQSLPNTINAIYAMHPSIAGDIATRNARMEELVASANAVVANTANLDALRRFVRSIYGAKKTP